MENKNYSELLDNLEKEVIYDNKKVMRILVNIYVLALLGFVLIYVPWFSSYLAYPKKLALLFFILSGLLTLTFARCLIDCTCSKNRFEKAKLKIKFMKLKDNGMTDEEKK